MKVSIIICTKNRKELLFGAVQSLFFQDFPKDEYEIVVVDDGSDENISDNIINLKPPCVVKYYYQNHKGRAAARNLGIKKAIGDYLIFVDDDVIVPEGFVKEHYDMHKKFPKSVVRGPIIDIAQYQLPDEINVRTRDYSTAFFCTCNASVERNGLLSIGGFDEEFTEYGWEDNETGYRLKRIGYYLKFSTKAVVYHYKPNADSVHVEELIDKAGQLGRNALLYYKKHPTFTVRLAIGLTPLHFLWQNIVANSLIVDKGIKTLQDKNTVISEDLKNILARRIFNHYYCKSLKNAIKYQKKYLNRLQDDNNFYEEELNKIKDEIIFSIQICSYNRKDILTKCLQALSGQNFPKDKFEVVLVDDGSNDGTGDAVKNLDLGYNLKYLYQTNQGLATARNTGIRETRGKYIIFIDDDIIADENLLKQHLIFHCVYPRTIIRGWVNHVTSLDDIKKPILNWQDISTSFFWTSNVSVERKDLIEVGLFDESFTEYGWEDLEIGVRLKLIGLKLKYNKNAVVYHFKKSWSLKDMERLCRQAKEKARMAVLFVEKYPIFRVRLATGVHKYRLLWHRITTYGGLWPKTCEFLIKFNKDKPFKGLSLMLARQVVYINYFDEIEKMLSKNEEN